jgi:hypothetical protein
VPAEVLYRAQRVSNRKVEDQLERTAFAWSTNLVRILTSPNTREAAGTPKARGLRPSGFLRVRPIELGEMLSDAFARVVTLMRPRKYSQPPPPGHSVTCSYLC